LLLKREWRAAAGFGLALAALLWLVPGLALGFDRSAALHADFVRDMIAPFARTADLPARYATAGLSLKSFLLLHLAPVSGDEGDRLVNLADLSPGAVWRIFLGCAAA